MNFGRKIAAMRAIRNMSQIAVAYQSGVNMDYISRAELGKRELNADQQGRIRIALDWPIELDAVIEQLAAGGFPK